MKVSPFLVLVAGIIVRFATKLHTLGDTLMWVGGGLMVVGLILTLALVGIAVAHAGPSAPPSLRNRPRR